MKWPLVRFRVEGKSMEPVIRQGERVLVFSWAIWFWRPKPGDLVVVVEPHNTKQKLLLKRAGRFSGDHVWVMGDNFRESLDSRHFGPIEKRFLVGRVIFRY